MSDELYALIERATTTHAGRPLFAVDKGGRWTWSTYRELGADAARLRAAMARLGVRRGDRVAVIAGNRPEWACVLAATLALGGVIVPMYEAQLEKDWAYILRDSGAKICFVGANAVFDKVRAMRGEVPALAHVIGFERAADDDTSLAHLLRERREVPATPAAPGDVATFIYTSGTTGSPKGVELTHAGLASVVDATRRVWALAPGQRAVSILPWAHVGGFLELLSVFGNGSAIALPSALDQIPAAIAATRPHAIIGVPRIWNKFYDAIHKAMREQPPPIRWLFERGVAAQGKRNAGVRLRKRERLVRRVFQRVLVPKILEKLGGELRFAISGAAALSKEVGEFFECLGVRMIEVYGQTEVCAVATANPPGAARMGSVGKAIPGVRIAIDRSVGDADDGSGEIVIYGPGRMRGYHGLAEETAAVLTPDGGVRTGDLGRLDEDGYVHITGRVREVYKLENGKFVTPVPIEEKITLSPYVSQAMVYGLNKPHNVALLVIDTAAVRAWCAEQGIDASDAQAILSHARVRDLVAREIDRHTAGFKGYERIKDFVLLAEEFTTGNDMLTPTLKLKRRNVVARYGEHIEALYRA